jgi:hypothetical protein
LADSKLRLDPSLLTPRDLKRAKVVLDGRNPFEMLEDPVDAMTLTVWCLRSREDPEFTWDQAEDTPLGDFDMAVEDEQEADGSPPSTAELATSGLELGSSATTTGGNGSSGSSKKRRSATSSA